MGDWTRSNHEADYARTEQSQPHADASLALELIESVECWLTRLQRVMQAERLELTTGIGTLDAEDLRQRIAMLARAQIHVRELAGMRL